MANNNISFKIGSSFQGEGFKKATEAIRQNKQELQSSVRGLGELTKAFADVSPTAGAAVDAVGSFTKAFTAGGIVGGTIELAIKGISKVIEYGIETYNKAAESVKEYANILRNDLVSAMRDSASAFGGLRDQITQSNREASDLLSVLNGEAAHEAANKVFEIKTKAFDNVGQMLDEASKKTCEALANAEIAVVKAKLAEEQSTNALNTYTKQVDIATKLKESAAERVNKAESTYAELQDQCSEYLKARAQVTNFLATEEDRFANKEISLAEILEARKGSALKLKEIDEKYADQQKMLNAASDELTKARNDLAKVEYEVVLAEDRQSAAQMKLEEARNELTLVTKTAAQKQVEHVNAMTEAQEDLYAAECEAFDALAEYNESNKRLKEATDNLSAARNMAASEELNGTGDGGKDDNKVRKVKVVSSVGLDISDRSTNPIEDKIDDPKIIDENSIRSFAASRTEERESARQIRDETTELNAKFGNEIGRFFNLLGTPEAARDADKRALVDHYTQKAIPAMIEKFGIERTQKFLENQSKKVLLRQDMKDLFGPSGTFVQTLAKQFGLK